MKKLIEILNGVKKASGWQITENAKTSNELFFVHEKLETVRATDTVDTLVTIYVEHDDCLGDSSFSVYSYMSDEDILNKINAAIERAKLVFNRPYKLVEGEKLVAEIPSDMNGKDKIKLAESIADAVFAAKAPEGGSLNALEVFVNDVKTRVVNSRGLDKTQTKRYAFVEAIPTFTDEKQSVEVYFSADFSNFDKDKLTEDISTKLAEAKARSVAQKPTTPMRVNVVLRADDISALLDELSSDMSYSAAYTQSDYYKIGDDICGGNGDKITLTLFGVVEGSKASSYFDDDGVALSSVTLVKDGVVTAKHGSNRFGQYLGVERPSGVLPCKALETGSLSQEKLSSEPYIECVALSALQVDVYSDYIGGEIRTAFYHDGKSCTPVTGITMSAKLSEVLKTALLSDKCVVQGSYKGPDKMLLKNVSVL